MTVYKTSEVAKAVGVHPNTIRNYEKWQLILPVPRSENGYRLFSKTHLNQAILVKLAFNCTWLSGAIRETALQIINLSANLDLELALAKGQNLLQLIIEEERLAKEALNHLENWADKSPSFSSEINLSRSQAARHLGITIYMLRDWERNRLITVPRNPENGYRVYLEEEIQRLEVIHMLKKARYSTMSILRMLTAFDQGRRDNFQELINDIDQGEDIYFATDQWLATLVDLQDNACNIITHIEMMITESN